MRSPRNSLKAGGAAALLALCALAAAPMADAHVPFLEPDRPSDAPAVQRDPFPGAIRLPDAAVSRAVYGTLAPAGLTR